MNAPLDSFSHALSTGSDSEHETDENESNSESDQEENKEENDDKDEEMDYTTSQLYDDVDIMLNEPVDTDKGFVQEEGTDAEMTNVQQRDEKSVGDYLSSHKRCSCDSFYCSNKDE
ncbi:hypothetical protein Tco_0784831 [Tanacetum coccineum]